MKKLKLFLVLVLGMLSMAPAMAQKGMQGVGVTLFGGSNGILHYTGGTSEFGFDFNYQRNFSDYYRLKPHLGLSFGTGMHFEMGLDNNIFFCSPRKIRPYVNLGLGFYTDEQGPFIMPSLGLGLDCRLSYKLSLQIEPTYAYLNDCEGQNGNSYRLKVGLTYNF